MIHKIIEFIASNKGHGGQYRKDGYTPYIYHPLAVMARLHRWQIFDKTMDEAALCHDLIEDCDVTREMLLSIGVSKEAADLVDDLTYVESQWKDKNTYLESFANKSIKSLIIKISDRLCNVEDWIYQDVTYAPKYLKKASSIFKAADDRASEIDQVFNKTVKLYMENDVRQIAINTSLIFHGVKKN